MQVQALAVPSLAASPCLVPYAAPSTLSARLARDHPALHAALHASPPGAAQRRIAFAWEPCGGNMLRAGLQTNRGLVD